MTEKQHVIPVWFFVGIMLLVYGVMILVSGIAEWPHPPDTVLSNLHAPVWWGGLLTVLGTFYTVHFWPKRGGRDGEKNGEGGSGTAAPHDTTPPR